MAVYLETCPSNSNSTVIQKELRLFLPSFCQSQSPSPPRARLVARLAAERRQCYFMATVHHSGNKKKSENICMIINNALDKALIKF